MTIEEFIKTMNESYFKAGAYHGMKNPDNNSTSGNHHVINATYYTIVNNLGKLTEEDREIANAYISACMEKPGIYNRAPDKFDHQAHDDTVAICATSKLLHLPHAGLIEDIPYYYYDNTEETTKFEFKNWHWRFVWPILTYKVCSGKSTNLFYQLGFCYYLYTGTKKKDMTDTSGRILRWLQKEAVKGKYKLVDWFIKKFEDNIARDYTFAMGDVFGIYYGYDHPFSLIMKGKV